MFKIQPVKSTKIQRPMVVKRDINIDKIEITKQDLDMFVTKYEKESNLSLFRGLPPEINLLKNVALKYKAYCFDRTIISNEDKEIILSMIAMNRNYREDIQTPTRLRDTIIDLIITYYEIEQDFILKYTHIQDYI